MRRTSKHVLVIALAAIACGAVAVNAHQGHHQTPVAKTTASPSATPPVKKLPAAAVKKVDLVGELVDPQCWYTHSADGKDHAKCALNCAKGGQDLAFFDHNTGELHTLLALGHGKNPNAGMLDHIGYPVRVKATSYQRGANRALLVEKVERVR